MTHILVAAGILLLLYVDVEAQGAAQAWWVGATFTPRGTVIEGIQIGDLDRAWKRASIISPSDLPPEARKPGDTIEEHGFSLALEADLDGDGKRERVVVGVYEATSGETGRFLLVLSQGRRTGQWEKRALFQQKGPPGFGAVSIVKGRLEWVDCLECDSGCDVIPTRGGFKLRCESCC
jgi:hypothetical protein